MSFDSAYQLIGILLLVTIRGIYSAEQFYTSDNNNEYFISNVQKYTWFDALSSCAMKNMTLAALETEEKTKEINKLVQKNSGGRFSLWVGGITTQKKYSRQSIWLQTGLPFNYSFWSDKNPDFDHQREYCVHIGAGGSMRWNDNTCIIKLGFICEYKTQPDKSQQLQLYLQDLKFQLEELRPKFVESETEVIKYNLLQLKKEEQQTLKQQLNQTLESSSNVLEELEVSLQMASKEKQQLQKEQKELKEILTQLKEIDIKKLEEGNTELSTNLQKALQECQQRKKELDLQKGKYRNIYVNINPNMYINLPEGTTKYQ